MLPQSLDPRRAVLCGRANAERLAIRMSARAVIGALRITAPGGFQNGLRQARPGSPNLSGLMRT